MKELLARLEKATINNPIKSSQLEREFNLNGSHIRDCVREWRREGKPIASDSTGYFYAKDQRELEHTIAILKSKALSQLETVKAMENCFVNEWELFQ